MTNDQIARGYLEKVRARLKALPILFEEADYSDVVREAQEIVELALKAALRFVGLEPPKTHDVGNIIRQHANRLPDLAPDDIERIVSVSTKLAQQRSLALYGDEVSGASFAQLYSEADAREALESAVWVAKLLERLTARQP